MSDVNDYKRQQLLDLPVRKWDEMKTYESLLLVPTRKKHDSGWHFIAVVGCMAQKPVEIAAHCDDVVWSIMPQRRSPEMHTDMTWPSGVVHVWGAQFTVGDSLSSTDITVTERNIK